MGGGDLLSLRRRRRAAAGAPGRAGGTRPRRLRRARAGPDGGDGRRSSGRACGRGAQPEARAGVARVIDAVVVGRVGIDLYPNQLRTPLRDVRTYTRFVGGFAGNVSTGLARLGVKTAILSRVGAEGHGEFVRDFLASEGIDVRYLRRDSVWPTPP